MVRIASISSVFCIDLNLKIVYLPNYGLLSVLFPSIKLKKVELLIKLYLHPLICYITVFQLLSLILVGLINLF